MTSDQIQTAVQEGIPFVIKMADGNIYPVTERSRIAWGGTCVVVVGDRDLPHVLPLSTMTGISYLQTES